MNKTKGDPGLDAWTELESRNADLVGRLRAQEKERLRLELALAQADDESEAHKRDLQRVEDELEASRRELQRNLERNVDLLQRLLELGDDLDAAGRDAARLQLQRTELEAKLAAKEGELRLLNQQSAELEAKLAAKEGELRLLNQQSAELEAKLAAKEGELRVLNQQSAEVGARLVAKENELRLHSQRRSELEAALAAQENEQRLQRAKLADQISRHHKLNQQLVSVRRALAEASAEVKLLRGSFSFRFGAIVIEALRSPKAALSFPSAMVRLVREALPRIKGRLRRMVRSAPQENAGSIAVDAGAANGARPMLYDLSDSGPSIRRLRPGPEIAARLPAQPRKLRMATIMDEFTHHAFDGCCETRQITSDDWREQLQSFSPDLLFVESAWKGKGGSWYRKISVLSPELRDLVTWCRERGIPSLFWNKEDPVHFNSFLRTARQFDLVFTTDIDSVRLYKSALGHDNVFWLPFAADPVQHNPVEVHERKDAFCFAGSYYTKYPERQRDFAVLVDAVRKLRPCKIYDRNAGTSDPALRYPAQYVPLIEGALSYKDISLAYKGYRFGINLNTVKRSQSMFARRAFDLLASNTVTVSNFSRGQRVLLGDLVIGSDDGGQLIRRIGPLLEDQGYYRRFRLAGLRKVLAEHTYQDRLRYVLEKLRNEPVGDELPTIAVVARVTDPEQAARVLKSFRLQEYHHKTLILVTAGADAVQQDALREEGIEILDMSRARQIAPIELGGAAWLAVFHPRDHHGRHYLTDFALATRYVDAAGIGKGAYFRSTEGDLRLVGDRRQYRAMSTLSLRRGMARVELLSDRVLADLVDGSFEMKLDRAFAIDEFNYCQDGASADCRALDDLADINSGLPLSRLHVLAEAASAEGFAIGGEGMPAWFSAEDLARLLPLGARGDGRVSLKQQGGELLLKSTLRPEEHAYVYAHEQMPIEEVFLAGEGKFNLLSDAEMAIALVFIFFDERRERIGHAFRDCGVNVTVAPPAGAQHVRIGLRVQGAGTAVIRKLVMGHVPSPLAGIPSPGQHLVVCKGYPSYDRLYSYAFVHRRILGYKEQGVRVDVFRLDKKTISFSEFEGVDVVTGRVQELELMIRSNRYESILVHALDQNVLGALKSCASGTRILVWVHGAEIQPWYRREFNLLSDLERDRAAKYSHVRMAFWRDLFTDLPDSITFVFVSQRLADEAMRDVGIDLHPSRYVVIHNHVDGSLFDHVPKHAAQRRKILSIRPYDYRTYANDLSVQAIIDLSREPYFGEIEFRLIGDGALFEETVAPLRVFDNVRLEQRFLNQAEIAALHKEYGIFLCPSRIDSQGVSRDEAMASGLVPVTNRVSAVPEFVDETCGVLAEPEDWRGLADGIRRLYGDQDLFLRMSANAAERVRRQSNSDRTLRRELSLIDPARFPAGGTGESLQEAPMASHRIALYGDLDLNLIDGSAVWAASLAEILAGIEGTAVDVFLKAPLRTTEVVKGLLERLNVRLIEPPLDVARLKPSQALDRIVEYDRRRSYQAVILRGFDLSALAVGRNELDGRLWIYLTDLPTRREHLTKDKLETLQRIASGARRLLCQTPQLEKYLTSLAPEAQSKTLHLPPMIPGSSAESPARSRPSGTLRLAYAGKFAPLWGIRELFETAKTLRARGCDIELHVFGDKIHDPPDDPMFKKDVLAALESDRGTIWHRGVSRGEVLRQLRDMDVGWAWRSPRLEQQTLELSTKVLEYAAFGAPPLLARNAINEGLLGKDYPLFVDESTDAMAVLNSVVADPSLLETARACSHDVAVGYSFERARERVAPWLNAP